VGAVRRSLVPRETEGAARSGGGAVVATGAKFDFQAAKMGSALSVIDDAEVEAMDQPAVAALLAVVSSSVAASTRHRR
jgi:hypothetical protein